ncbi:MAG: LysR family transcriptional regulator [Betaproteobacteria bacterium]|nr:MAG: LysR family transcriptional regulator [Betaproteobacteria bacterium]
MPASLYEMSILTKTIAAGSLSAAAREMGVSTAVVSRKLSALEARLGVRLLNRTTRRIALTDEGARYHEACVRILAEVEEADAAASARRVEPQGLLRIALPTSFGQKHIAPLIPRFAELHPKVQLALSLSDRTVNVVDEGFDVAVRIAELEDSSLAARRLAPNRRVICASPEYLRRHGKPQTPQDLVRHNCLTTTDFSMLWEYKDPAGRPGSVRVSGHYACDNWTVLRDWAVAGLGVALKSTWDVRRDLEDGSLELLFPAYTFGGDVGIYAVYPHRRYLPAKTRVFIDFLADSFGPEPYWDRPFEPRRAERAAA